MPKRVFMICHYCGFDPPAVPPTGVCPKCGQSSWERFALPEPLIPPHMK
jgi:primosomal protein N'